jgi:D-alanyl-lipoteichoic acid acyltransferase DltB (MBOAT superfamily)
MVVADNCARLVDPIFDNYENMSSSSLIMGVVLFAFQIYGDFAGYSNIAIGTSKLLGYSLLPNFKYPYFSRDIAEFWRRWHVSLSTWFRDYLYIPLGGSKGGVKSKIRNTYVIFLVSGFWHGANWTFIIWGFLNALFFLPLLISNKNRVNTNNVIAQNSLLPSIKELVGVLFTFVLISTAWVFFRSNTVSDAFNYFRITIEGLNNITIPYNLVGLNLFVALISISFLLFIEYLSRKNEFGLSTFGFKWNSIVRKTFYVILAFSIFLFSGKNQGFIYFQF